MLERELQPAVASGDAPKHPFERWRLRKGWTQEEMGKAIGATQARISKFEKGRIPRLEPEQAKAAELVSDGSIKANDCLYDTPWAMLQESGVNPDPPTTPRPPRRHRKQVKKLVAARRARR